jgi:predicted esterase
MWRSTRRFVGGLATRRFLILALISPLGLAAGCSQDGGAGSGSGGAGDSPGTGGKIGSGGMTAGSGGSGGMTAGSGGMTAGSGGMTAGSGGATASGGTTSSGGTNGSGGAMAGSGGVAGRGGAPASGSGGATGGAAGSAPAGGTSGAVGGRGGAAAGGRGGADSSGGGAGGDGQGGAAGGQPSAGCGKTTARPDRRTQQTISVGGTTRYYLLNVPTNAGSTPLPLVFALHGYDMNNVSLVDLYDFTSQSGNKAITVLPQGEGPAPGNTSHWGDGVLKSTWTANAANYDFMQSLKTEVQDKFCVDTSRVYMTGFSMGGLFTNSTACEHVDWFRGFAPVEGGGPSSCANAAAKPAVIIHQGNNDTIAKPEAGQGTRDFWTMRNGCNATTSSIYTGCLSYGACAQPVLYCTGNWDHTVSATARANIWKFFDSLK